MFVDMFTRKQKRNIFLRPGTPGNIFKNSKRLSHLVCGRLLDRGVDGGGGGGGNCGRSSNIGDIGPPILSLF
jgi:hypothetical protein